MYPFLRTASAGRHRVAPAVVMFLALLGPAPLRAATVVVTEADRALPLARYAECLSDADGRLTAAEALAAPGWRANGDDHFRFGFHPGALWVRWTIAQRAASDRILDIPQTATDRIDLYRFLGECLLDRHLPIGDRHPVANRDIDHHHLCFTVPRDERPITYLARFESSSYLTFPATLYEKETFQARTRWDLAVMWAFFGMMAVMAIYNLLIYLSVRDSDYLFYVLLCLAYALHVFTCKGFAYQNFWPQSPQWANTSSSMLLFLMIVMHIAFSQHFLQLSKNAPRLNRGVMVSYVLSAFVIITVIIFKTPRFTNVGFTIYSLLSVFLSIHALGRARLGDRSALFYLIAWVGLFSFTIVGILYTAGVLVIPFVSVWAPQIGGLVQTTFMSFGLGERINAMRLNLRELNIHLEEKVEQRTRELERANTELERKSTELEAAMEEMEAINDNLASVNHELRTAHLVAQTDMEMDVNVQRRFLPETAPPAPDWDIAVHFKPMTGVSGDFYDFYLIDGELLGVGVYDVSGHGIASGLVTMIAKTIIYNNFRRGIKRGEPAAEIIARANEDLKREIESVGYYITGIMLRFAGDTVEYVNAGHPDLYLKRGGEVHAILTEAGEDAGGAFLGITGLATMSRELRLTAVPGDFLVLFTDCLLEARNAGGEEFRTTRLAETLARATADTARGIIDQIMAAFNAFVTDPSHLHDDLTVMVLRRRGPGEAHQPTHEENE